MQEANMERNELLNGHFTYKSSADGALDRTPVICSHVDISNTTKTNLAAELG